MPKVMALPKMGVNMEKAKIVEWVVRVGEMVQLDQHLLNAETDKALLEIPSTVSGVLAKQMAQVGQTVFCGEPLAVFIEPGEKMPSDVSLDQEQIAPATTQTVARTFGAPLPDGTAQTAKLDSRVRITPLAKKIAKDLGIDYMLIRPAKSGARITKGEVLAYAESLKATPFEKAAGSRIQLPVDESLTVKETIPLDGIQGTIAERLWQSTQTTARAVIFKKAVMTNLIEWRENLKTQGHPVSFNSFTVALVAKALSEFPRFNARIVGQGIQLIDEINVGVAVDTDRGLLVPTIRQAVKRGVVSIDLEFKEKAERAKAGRSTLEDLSGGTFTITNLGMFGVEAFIPIINPPEAAILALGAVHREQIVQNDDTVIIKPVVNLALVWDHRLNDGVPAARFLDRIKELIEWPMGLIC